MGLEEVKQGLEKELEQKRSQVLAEGEKEKKRIMDKAREEVSDYREEAEKKTKEVLAMLERREMASANLKVKKDLLQAQKELIDEAFDKAMEKLVSMKPEKKKEVLKKLIAQAGREINVKKVYCSKDDMNLVEGYETEPADIKGGVICESADKKSRVDLTFDTLLNEIREKNLQEIAGMMLR